MSKSWNRIETWLTLIVAGVGVVVLGVGGLWVYVSATAPTLHPNAQDVTSVAERDSGATVGRRGEQGRQIVRAASPSRTCRDFRWRSAPAASIVWAEGFGWANLENKVPFPLRRGSGSAPPPRRSPPPPSDCCWRKTG